MTHVLYGLFYVAILVLVAVVGIYVYRTRPEKLKRGGTVTDLPALLGELFAYQVGSQLTAELTESGGTMLVTRTPQGLGLRFSHRLLDDQGEQPESYDDEELLYELTKRLTRLSREEALTPPGQGEVLPEVVIPAGRAKPEMVAEHLFRGGFEAEDSDPVRFQAVLHRVAPEYLQAYDAG